MIAATLFSVPVSTSNALTSAFSDYEYGYGPIASINKDWILAGHFMGYYSPNNLTDSGFHSTFDMVMINGSSPHMHQISDATVNDVRIDGNNTILQGAATITMTDGPVSNVSTTWTIYNNNSISISMDPSKINNHFGNTPIYGILLTPEKEMETMNAMMEDKEFMDKWIPLMMQNVMANLQISGGNATSMSMSNLSINEIPSSPNSSNLMIQ
jgi:hypothetical protein